MLEIPPRSPFVIDKDGTREEVIETYREWLLSQPELVEQAREQLKVKVLGCRCNPELCHGDLVAEMLDGASG